MTADQVHNVPNLKKPLTRLVLSSQKYLCCVVKACLLRTLVSHHYRSRDLPLGAICVFRWDAAFLEDYGSIRVHLDGERRRGLHLAGFETLCIFDFVRDFAEIYGLSKVTLYAPGATPAASGTMQLDEAVEGNIELVAECQSSSRCWTPRSCHGLMATSESICRIRRKCTHTTLSSTYEQVKGRWDIIAWAEWLVWNVPTGIIHPGWHLDMPTTVCWCVCRV